MCKKTGDAGLSSSFDGSPVHLFLLKDGKVIEHMHGNYDSYGRVFDKDKNSFEWKLPWSDVCDLMFKSDRKNGIALIHDRHWKEGDPYPIERSNDDPNQGWGETENEMDRNTWPPVKKPYHKVYDV